MDLKSQERREHGSYYTPRSVVRYIVDGALREYRRKNGTDRTPIRILDPACGDGAFLLYVYDALQSHMLRPVGRTRKPSRPRANPPTEGSLTLQQRLGIVRDNVFGVDRDRAAVETLRRRLLERIAPDEDSRELAVKILKTNIRVGDALTGPGFDAATVSQPRNGHAVSLDTGTAAALDWGRAFPAAARDGGFDIVVGNPPYRRELQAKALFERIARSELGRWKQARMDLWYYFLHRGLDLLRPSGRLAFVVNSYWTASRGAMRLISRLERECTLEEIVLLGRSPLFADVSGRHLIFRLKQGRHAGTCRVIDMSGDCSNTADSLEALCERPKLFSRPVGDCDMESYRLSRKELFREGRMVVSRPNLLDEKLRGLPQLAESYEVRQGLAENPPRITARHCRMDEGRYRLGAGVFVLKQCEVEALHLPSRESDYLRPYFETKSLGRYACPSEPSHELLYLTPETAPSLEGLGHIRRHLETYRPIMERRRETRMGKREWWQLHWPREERVFTRSRILCVQMGRVPQFTWMVAPTFVGFSVNLILAKTAGAAGLGTLTGILNSAIASSWFRTYAKRRGCDLEINGGLLERFPLPPRDALLEARLEQLVVLRQRPGLCGDLIHGGIEELEAEIDATVCQLYGVSRSDIGEAHSEKNGDRRTSRLESATAG